VSLPENRIIYTITKNRTRNKYNSKNGFEMPVNEMHIYTYDVLVEKEGLISLSFSK